ncbi:MAG: S1 RNA-binding domain-containing protein, partial [Gammaproteobacteria bacterium]
YKKGDEVETVVLAVDAQRERISLGIKQLEKDPFSTFLGEHPKGSLVKGKVTAVDAKGANVDLGNGIEGYLRASELSRDRVEDARTVLKEGDEIEARFIGMDRKNRNVSLSVKAKEMHEETQAMEDYARNTASATTTLGDLLKEQIAGGREE